MNFITVKKAKEIIEKEIFKTVENKISLKDSLHYYTAQNIYAPLDVPNFDNSAMDGYAFSYKDFEECKKIKVSYTIQAGDSNIPSLRSGEAIRIFTGAPIPHGADTVIMQEKISLKNDYLIFNDSQIKKGQNIRLRGSQSKKGDLLISSNTKITAGVLGFLAGFGFTHLYVNSYPKIGIIVTGNELTEVGNPLEFGQIYETNSWALQAALQELNILPTILIKVKDNKELTLQAIKKAWEKADILLITGGISVGDYDFVQEALENLGTKKLFYKIQQKPGKPIYFGKKENQFVFALPGNPASVLTCFYQYVHPFIEGIKGRKNFYEEKYLGALSSDFEKNNNLTLFLKAYEKDGKVKILSAQESYKMDNFSKSNCIAEIEGGPRILKQGEKISLWKI